MLTALRRRLTLLMTALTSLVLAGALVVTWNYAAAQYRTAAGDAAHAELFCHR